MSSPEFRFIPQPFESKDQNAANIIEYFKELPYPISTNIPPTTVDRFGEEGIWYSQGKQRYATCLTWALINAEYSLGTNMENIEWGYELHEKTLSRQTNRGLTKNEARNILKKYPKREIDLIPLSLDQALLPLFEWPPSDTNYDWTPDLNQQWTIEHNAKVIKTTIDQGRRLVTSILGGYDLNETDTPITHAVTITGYSVSETGEMEIEVVDPTFGVLYPALTHFSTVIADQRDFQDPITWIVQRR